MCVLVCHRHKWKLSEHVTDCDRGGGGSAVGATYSALRLSLAVRFVSVHLIACSGCVFRPIKPGGHSLYRQFNIQQFYVVPTHCIYVFYVDVGTNSNYFPIEH